MALSPDTYSSFLLVRLSSLGDVLLISPLLRQLRATYPNAKISVITDHRFAEVLQYNPHISAVHTYNKSWTKEQKQEFRESISPEKYDIVADLQGNRHSHFLLKKVKNVLSYNKRRLEKLLLVYAKKRPSKPIIPIPLRYTLTLKPIGILPDEHGLELWLQDEFLHYGNYPPLSRTAQQCNGIIIAPGARHATKRWLPEYFAQAGLMLQDKLQQNITLVGAPDDTVAIQETATILQQNGVNPEIVIAQSLQQTAKIFDNATILLCNDSAVMHIAAARRLPLVAIFGSTVQELGFTPYFAHHRIAEMPDLSCRPCTHIGRNSCPKRHFRCMNDVLPSDVAALASELLPNKE